MRICNPHLARSRKRRGALLPQVAQFTFQGLTCRDIAAKLGVSKSTVNYWQQKLPQELPAYELPEAGGTSALRSKRYDSIYQRAIRAWDRTQSDKKTSVVERTVTTDAEGGTTKKKKRSLRKETHAVKSSLLNAALAALKGLDGLQQSGSPPRNEEQDPDGQSSPAGTIPMSSLSVDDFHDLTDLQLDALEARLLIKYGKDAKRDE